MNFKIVSDSASNLLKLENTSYYSTVPLHILAGEKSFTDNEALNIHEMYETLADFKGKTSTSCPCPEDWIQAFEDAEAVFCVTITSGLSGSCGSAHTAKHMYEEQYPDRKVYIVDSLSTGPEMVLLIEKLVSLLDSGEKPEEAYKKVCDYHKKTHLFYALASLNNLARNGRVNPLLAKGIGALGIRVIGTTTEEGTLKPIDKGRGDKKAMQKMFEHMKKHGFKGGRVILSHSENLQAAEMLRDLIIQEFGAFNGYIHDNTGLCGYYAEIHSVLAGFEE